MKRIIRYLHLNEIGLLELLVALYPIISGYRYPIIAMHPIYLYIFVVIALFKKRKPIISKPLFFLLLFIIMHGLLLCLTTIDPPSYLINNILSNILGVMAIFFIVPILEYKKFVGSINFVALISIIGIVYHFIIIQSGGFVTPIKLPFLPNPIAESRLFEEVMRPCSFYWEPASFVTFMMIPLFLSIYSRKYLWTFVIVLSLFLSTSTTGIVMGVFIIMIYIITQNISTNTRLLMFLLGIILIVILFTSSFFEFGVTKLVETDIEESARLMNGPYLVFSMPLVDLLKGMPTANATDYYQSGRLASGSINILLGREGAVYVSTFWLTIAKYGVLGLILFLNVYIKIMNKAKVLLPYLSVILISLLFQSFPVGTPVYCFQMIFILSFIRELNIKQ